MKKVLQVFAVGLMLVSCGQSTVPVALQNSSTQTSVEETGNISALAIYNILAQCNIQVIDPVLAPNPPARVTGRASDRNRDVACREAKRQATQSAPRGTYARHCQCLDILG